MPSVDHDAHTRVLESEYAAIAHALEVVAEAAGSPVRADEASRAVLRVRRACNSCLEAAEVAAAELGLTVRRRSAQDGGVAVPALALLDDGRWLAVKRREGHRLSVSVLDTHTVTTEMLSYKELETLVRGRDVLHFAPRLPLQAASINARSNLAKHPWSRLKAFLGVERRDLIVVGVYAVVIGMLTLATPIAVQAVVNSVAFGATLQPLVVLTILLFGGLSFSALLRLLETYVVEVLQRRYFVRVADDFGRRLASMPASAHDKKYFGPELVNRFFDIVTVQKSLSTLALDGLSLALQTGVGMILLGFYHPLLLAFDVVLVILLIFVLVIGRGAINTALDESSAKYKVAAWLEDVARVPRLFVGASAREHAWNRADVLTRDYISARKSHFRVLLRQLSGGMFLQVIAVVSLLGVGGYLVLTRQLTLGQLVAAELIVTAMGAGFSKVSKHLEKLYDLGVGVMKIGKVLDQPAERGGGERPRGTGPVKLSAGGVSLKRGSKVLVRGITIDIEPGSRVLIDGEAGSGKTTLLEVLSGVRAPGEGGIQHDGLDLRRADLASIRDFSVMVGRPRFVTGSVLDNLFLGGVPLPEPETRRLLQLLELEDTIDSLEKGLDEPMKPDGSPFSERQQRRLSLVRGLAHQPRALLLDRSLDGLGLSDQAMDAVLDTLFAPDAPWTLVVVSDNPRVRERCQQHFRIDGGKLEVVS